MPESRSLPTDIPLEPWEWYTAGWRKLPPLPRPTPTPFARVDCLRRVAAVKVSRGEWDWSAANIGPVLDPEEGRFWLEAFSLATSAQTPSSLSGELRRLGRLGRLGASGCAERLRGRGSKPPEIVPAIASQIGVPALIELLLDRSRLFSSWQADPLAGRLLIGFRKFVRPWLSESEAAAARQLLHDHVQQYAGGSPDQLPADSALALMGCLGMGEAVARLAPLWEPTWGEEVNNLRFLALLGLADAARISGEMSRLRLTVTRPEQARALIACLEENAIPILVDGVLLAGNRARAETLTAALGLVLRPTTARAMLVLSKKSRATAPAQRWLDEHPELALPGILPLVNDQEHAEAVANYLRQQVRAGRQALIDRHLDGIDPEAAARVRRALDTTTAAPTTDEVGVPLWFPQPPRRAPRLPGWLDPATLPPLRIEGKRLPITAVTTLLALLRDSTLDNPPELCGQIKKHAEPRTLDAFAWAVFDRWHSASGDAKDKWALVALGLLGGDGICLPLARLIAEWPTRNQSMRASLGLQCLELIGTRLAQLCIRRLAVSCSYAVGDEARFWFEGLAKRNGLSVQEMEDRVVPDLGLDAAASCKLDCSGATFRLAIGPDHQARLLDSRRQYLEEWPALAEGEDPSAVEEARGEWALFRDQVREVMQMQSDRLEKGMLNWRRWRFADFNAWIVRHPLMRHFARAVLWGVFDSLSALRQAFRVTEGGTCVDAAGGAIELAENDSIGVLHPVLLPDDERLVWSDVLAEQGLALPAWQMARPVWPLHDSERSSRQISRWLGRKIRLGLFADVSRRKGYESGATQRNHRCCRVRYFAIPDVTVYLLHTPLPEDYVYSSESEEVEVLGAQFRPGDTRTRVPNEKEALELGSVDPVLLDEVIGLLNEVVR
jgi:hypothetical protein